MLKKSYIEFALLRLFWYVVPDRKTSDATSPDLRQRMKCEVGILCNERGMYLFNLPP